MAVVLLTVNATLIALVGDWRPSGDIGRAEESETDGSEQMEEREEVTGRSTRARASATDATDSPDLGDCGLDVVDDCGGDAGHG